MPLTPVIDLPSEWQEEIDAFISMRFRYQSAMREVRTKLEILDDEFSMQHSRKPIHACLERKIPAQGDAKRAHAERRAALSICKACLQLNAKTNAQQHVYQRNPNQHSNSLFSSACDILYNEEKTFALFQWRNL